MSKPATMPLLRIITDLGDIVIELRPDRAPRTVTAFLSEVERAGFDGGSFGRIVRADNDRGEPPIEVIQASAQAAVEQRIDVAFETTDESGLRHQDGVISLPRADEPLATAQGFFICIGDQPALDARGGRSADASGFAAFGRVVEGMEVVKAIHRIPTMEQAPTAFVRGQMASEPVAIHRIVVESESDHLSV